VHNPDMGLRFPVAKAGAGLPMMVPLAEMIVSLIIAGGWLQATVSRVRWARHLSRPLVNIVDAQEARQMANFSMIGCAHTGNGTRPPPTASWHCWRPVVKSVTPSSAVKSVMPSSAVKYSSWHSTVIACAAAREIRPKKAKSKTTIRARLY